MNTVMGFLSLVYIAPAFMSEFNPSISNIYDDIYILLTFICDKWYAVKSEYEQSAKLNK
jgi:hypothetical protein